MALPTPNVTPCRPLSNATNIDPASRVGFATAVLPTPPQDVGCKRRIAQPDDTPSKRPRVVTAQNTEDDVDMGGVEVVNSRTRRQTMFNLLTTASFRSPIGPTRTILPSRRILQSFVSSHKSDVYTCHSLSDSHFVTPPYACAYSNAAKRNSTPFLAVATEEGSVMILNTSKRHDWEFESQRTLFQPHYNGIFDIKWNLDDSILATASGDKRTHITSVETHQVIQVLQGHSSTVKCIAWNPSHPDLLSTGSRDGNICLWDLRVAADDGNSGTSENASPLRPVTAIDAAHGQEKNKGERRKTMHLPRSVTGLLYSNPDTLVSCGSFDGILNMWDLRQPKVSATGKRTKKPPPMAPACMSPTDPTMLHGARRARGLMALCAGSGPTSGLLFALGADNYIHAYDSSSLTHVESITHPNMLSSFYVRLASSPCGRWLASGCMAKNGSLFLYDVSNVGRLSSAVPPTTAVEFRGQTGEVGAVDWATDMIASCADDRTVRVWRPDPDAYQDCIAHPEERAWEWSWSTGVYPS
ncbi:WD40-repeat-containing domain protein [Pisolithus tinctorius]|nr:WD40-repeat-containing domain protein [Pisolithus tinctorius]